MKTDDVCKIIDECKAARRYVLDLMRFIDPYGIPQPSEVFSTLQEFNKAIDNILDISLSSQELDETKGEPIY